MEKRTKIFRETVISYFYIKNLPKVIINHHNQLLSLEAKSVECLTINVHLANDNPKPDKAPYREAIVWQKHMSNKNPIQLKINATENQLF